MTSVLALLGSCWCWAVQQVQDGQEAPLGLQSLQCSG